MPSRGYARRIAAEYAAFILLKIVFMRPHRRRRQQIRVFDQYGAKMWPSDLHNTRQYHLSTEPRRCECAAFGYSICCHCADETTGSGRARYRRPYILQWISSSNEAVHLQETSVKNARTRNTCTSRLSLHQAAHTESTQLYCNGSRREYTAHFR